MEPGAALGGSVKGIQNMASKTLGRVVCPVKCGHEAAQVKLKTDKEAGKTAFPYVHCSGCGIQLHARNQEQAEHLLRTTRPEKGVEAPVVPVEAWKAPETPPGAAPVASAPPVPPIPLKPRGGLFPGIFDGISA
jgi:hypothetical protein